MSAFLPVHAARFARGLVCERRLRPSAPAVNGFFIRMKIVSLRSLAALTWAEIRALFGLDDVALKGLLSVNKAAPTRSREWPEIVKGFGCRPGVSGRPGGGR